MKTCSKCKQTKPLTEFHQNKTGKFGRKSTCKICSNAKSLEWRLKNQERVAKNQKHYAEVNKFAIRKKTAAWRLANPKKAADAVAAWREKNPEKVKLSAKLYAKNNPDRKKEHHQNRRARKKSSGGKISAGLVRKLFALQKGLCVCCNFPLGDDYHLDHILPLALGGSNADENMQLLRAKCNMQKKDKHPIDFMQSRGFLL